MVRQTIKELNKTIKKLKKDIEYWYNKYADLESNRASCCVANEFKFEAALKSLQKIAEAERMGYGTQRTYGEMAIKAVKELTNEKPEANARSRTTSNTVQK